MNTYVHVKMDSDGRFMLAPFEQSYSVVVAHQRGFAILKSAPVRGTRDAPAEITLQPWGRVEGTLRIGNRPGVRQRVNLTWSEPAGSPVHFVQQSLDTTTDDEGRFVFERVLSGTWRVEANRSQLIPAFSVDPGQVTRLVLGGTGRPVVGRLSLPDEMEAIPVKRVNAGFWSRAERSGRPEGRTDEERKQRDEEAGNNRRWFGFTPQPDGTFRMEDVPPGNYEIVASCYEEISEVQNRELRMVGMVRRTITVPEIPGEKGDAAKPFDIGTVSLEPFLAAGQPAPEFRATTFDGKPIRLSDFRGKHVLIVFWGLNQRGGLEESRAIRSLLKYKSLANGERLVILGVCIGPSSMNEARAVASQRGWDWLNAVDVVRPRGEPRVEASDSPRVRYSLRSRPSVWLIGPDGKIVGRDLRGDAIKAAAETVLRAK
jgi:peroxiredoxin